MEGDEFHLYTKLLGNIKHEKAHAIFTSDFEIVLQAKSLLSKNISGPVDLPRRMSGSLSSYEP
jgi:hypothetical protein